MLEERSFDSYLVSSRVFSSSCLSESKWPYMYPRDLCNGKRQLEIDGVEFEDDLRQIKSRRLSDCSGLKEKEQSVSDNGEDFSDSDNSVRQEKEQSDSEGDDSLHCSTRQEKKQSGCENMGDSKSGGHSEDDTESESFGDSLGSLSNEEIEPSESDNSGDSSGSDSLIPKIGSDNSINCLIRCSRADYGSIASVNRSFRSLIRNGEIYRLRRQNGFTEHWVYFSCQASEWEAFDPVLIKWMHLPIMPCNEVFRNCDKESLAVGTDLLVFGKEFTSLVIYRYSLLTNSWSLGKTMNAPRCLFGSASLGEIAILAGGCDSSGRIVDTAEMYNSEDQTWTTLPRMNKPRKMCSGFFMDDKFYVIGGVGGSEATALTCGEEYDLKTKKWTEIPNMCPPRGGEARENEVAPGGGAPPLVAVVNNQLYAADHAEMEVKKYDKERRRWVRVGRLPERADSMNGWGLAFRACGDQLIVIGGPVRNSFGGFIELNSWIPSEGPPQWKLLARKPGDFVYNCAVMGC